MSGWDDDEPRRDERRASARDVAPHRSRKNRRRWCRGKVGVEHVVETRIGKYALYRRESEQRDGRAPSPTCYRAEWWPQRWWCNHEQYCTACGKILVITLGDDCPDYRDDVTVPRRR